jgi:DNA-binding NarL/FixJ family response regulator
MKWFDQHLDELDCALIDLVIPRQAGLKEAHSLVGLSIVEELRKNRLFPGLVLVLTNSRQLADGERALAAGCDGYLCKHAPQSEVPALIEELKLALTGNVVVISREMRHVFVRAELSSKESQIMEFLSEGNSWAEIARKMGYKSSNAACTVAYRAFDKLLSHADLDNLANSSGESKLEKAVERWRVRTGKK